MFELILIVKNHMVTDIFSKITEASLFSFSFSYSY